MSTDRNFDTAQSNHPLINVGQITLESPSKTRAGDHGNLISGVRDKRMTQVSLQNMVSGDDDDELKEASSME